MKDARLAAKFLSIPGLFQERITDIFIPANKNTEIATHLGMDGSTPFTSEQFSLVIDRLVVAQSSAILGAASTWTEQFVLNIDAKLLMSKTMRLKVNELNAAQCAGLA